MEQTDPGPIAKIPPPRRRRPVFFYLMVALSLSIVIGTAFLSNDMRNLRLVLKRAGLDWLPEKAASGAAPAPKPVLPAPPAPKSVPVNPRLWLAPEPNVASALRRIWQMSGPDMCHALRAAGIGMSEWKAAAIGGPLYECSYERIYRKDGDRILSSLFVIVRGDATGRITSMRAKLVDPPQRAGGGLDPALVSIFETMLTQSRWGDFDAQLEAIRSLRDVRKEGFGAAMSFTREFDDSRNFNFLLTLKAVTPAQKRMNDLLRGENGFEMPVQDENAPLFPGLPGSPGMLGGPPATPIPSPQPLPRMPVDGETQEPAPQAAPSAPPPGETDARDSVEPPRERPGDRAGRRPMPDVPRQR